MLFETHQQNDYDRILVIDCEEQQQIERTLARDKRSIIEIKNIMKSQVSRKKRMAGADDLIDNTQDESALEEQVKNLHTQYISSTL